MRALFINSVCGIGSTGRICTDLAQELTAQGYEVKIAYGRLDQVPQQFAAMAERIGSDTDLKIHGLRTRLLDDHGLASRKATKAFLGWADKYDPDLLWLHNIHGYYINYELLFDWIKSRPGMQVKWTLHDCWAFTGHCCYFTMAQCDKWKTGCSHCPQKSTYPASCLTDRSGKNYAQKKAAFTGVKNMTLITPSKWLADLTRESFLSEYDVEVRYNTIDTAVFRPTESSFKKDHGVENKKIILGVSNAWQEPRKGLKDFYRLAERLDERFAAVLVGMTEELIKDAPKGIITVKKTSSPAELAGIYSVAECLFNPTYEDNYPTVNLEAEACGTRVITYASGGAPETLHRTDSVAVKPGDIDAVLRYIAQ